MHYKEFVKIYVEASDVKKSSIVKKHIVKDYVSYEEKIAESKEIVSRAHYVVVGDKKVYMRNSPLAYELFVIRLFVLYTDIQWEDGEVLDMFNEMSKNKIVEQLAVLLPNGEFDAFQTVLSMVTDDEYENYRSLAGFFSTKLEALELSLNAIASALPEIKES